MTDCSGALIFDLSGGNGFHLRNRFRYEKLNFKSLDSNGKFEEEIYIEPSVSLSSSKIVIPIKRVKKVLCKHVRVLMVLLGNDYIKDSLRIKWISPNGQ